MSKHAEALKRQRERMATRAGETLVRVRALSATKRAALLRARLMEALTETRFTLKDQVFFAKRLSFLMNAGIPIVEGLLVLRKQATSKGQLRVLDLVLADVSNGQSLSSAFAKFPKAFSEFAVHIIKIGEESGTLAQNLEYLAEELKKSQKLRRKVVGAFIYPALISVATLGITAFLVLYLFPKIMPVFTSLHATLPLPTRIVMAVSVFLQQWGLYVLVGVVAVVVAIRYALKHSPAMHLLFDRAVLRVPLVGTMIQNYNIAMLSRTVGLLLRSGIKVSEAFYITADTTKNLVYRRACQSLAQAIARGERVSTHMQSAPFAFPAIFAHMIAVGEESGTLSKTLVYLSEMYEAEVEEFTKNLSTLIEPALMIVMGLLVGFIAISIITPIYGITQNLHG